MKLFQWHFGLYLLPLAFLFPVSNAEAAAVYTCTVEGFSNSTFPNITPANANDAEINTRLTYRCNNTNNETGYVSVCFSVDGGSYGSSQINPRYMARPGPGPNLGPNLNSNRLGFNMKVAQPMNGSNIWGNGVTGLKLTRFHNVAPGGKTAQVNGTSDVFTTVNVKLLADNLSAIPGNYLNNFIMKMTWATTDANDTGTKGCNAPTGFLDKPFTVSATVIPDCVVSPTADVNLGNPDASQTNIKSTTTMNVTCTATTPYNIGLAPNTASPSNDMNGSGLLNGIAPNTDKVPYQLYSNLTGTKWGNNGSTVATLTNGVTGTGDGKVQSKTVYVTVPNADFKPDTYKDTVTINVNY